ncbi:hypothetical protein D3C71_1646020 [compost metagenome]
MDGVATQANHKRDIKACINERLDVLAPQLFLLGVLETNSIIPRCGDGIGEGFLHEVKLLIVQVVSEIRASGESHIWEEILCGFPNLPHMAYRSQEWFAPMELNRYVLKQRLCLLQPFEPIDCMSRVEVNLTTQTTTRKTVITIELASFCCLQVYVKLLEHVIQSARASCPKAFVS